MAADVRRVVIIVLDGLGVGATPDAAVYSDGGADTLGHIRAVTRDFSLPNLSSLGLYRLLNPPVSAPQPVGAYGRMRERSQGKDTTTGHWELAGVVVERPFPTYPRGFPQDVIGEFERRIGTRTLGNCTASGTEIIQRLGPEHVRTGYPIVYTSADSVFQIAAHETVVPLERLYALCREARAMLGAPPFEAHRVARVIARPFTGDATAGFVRTPNRRDFSVEPDGVTVLDRAAADGVRVVGIGKIEDIFARRGITNVVHTTTNDADVTATVHALQAYGDRRTIVFANLVDFDMLWGHRRDPAGYYRGLQAFDRRLPEIQTAMRDGDLLVVTADHGNDPTFTRHTDHTREYVPLLCWSCAPGFRAGVDLGVRESFADVAATVARHLGVPWGGAGCDLWDEVFTL
jgi:phosphopentomutase